MKSHLQVKVYSMSAEMSYIRRKEEQWKTRARIARQRSKETPISAKPNHLNADYAEKAFWSSRWHREDMKVEARTSHLTYGFMKGRSYEQMEHICYGQLKGFGSSEPNWKAIEAMMLRFTLDEPSPQDWMQRFSQWLEAAKVWYEGNKQRIDAFNKGRPARLEALKALKKPYEPPTASGELRPAKPLDEAGASGRSQKAQEKHISTAFSNASHHS